ncbi:hypothetical protein [uncultured Dietzia sp.]|uniref:hypothetical protein n=1 Tax=uncultured Dietzia sp. TaxID=395519 RepID=UPI0025F6B88F|nr:hypothetical protein [uncultured Dietzia sp.]
MVRIEDLEVLTTLLVDTLQSVFGIPHPAILEPAPQESLLHRVTVPEDPHEGEDRLPIDQAYVPESLNDLRWAVSHIIRSTHRVYVAHDEDGTFALRRGNSGLAARVFKRDRSLILDCIRRCEEQAICWSESGKAEEDDETAEVYQGEAAA